MEELIKAFDFKGEFVKSDVIGDGHINSTFAFTFLEEGKEKRYLVQQINTFVFTEPVKLMENMVGVTKHINKKILLRGGDPLREGLIVYPALDGKPYYVSSDGKYWRCFNFVENAHTYQIIPSAEVFGKGARAFGNFQKMLADYPIDSLHETIVNFHNTKSRFNDFKKAVEENISGRKCNVEKEIAFFMEHEKDYGVIVDLIEKGELPLRVTHNDTKLNNVMFDNDMNDAICVVDLDTVMPGSSLYDFGDAIRSGCNTAAEDEKDLSKVNFSLELYESFVKGWLEACGNTLTENEVKFLPFSAKLMTLECGMRFLGDYLNGDVYFKTDYPDHNLVRARTQIKLVEEMERVIF